MLKTNLIYDFNPKSQDDYNYEYFSKGCRVVRTEEHKVAMLTTYSPNKTMPTFETIKTAELRDLFSYELSEVTFEKVGLECVKFPKFKWVKADKLKVGDRIKYKGKIATIDEITNCGYMVNSDTIRVSHNEMVEVSMFESKALPQHGDKILYKDELKEIQSIEYFKDESVEYFKLHFIDGETSESFIKKGYFFLASNHLTESDAK